MSEREDVLQAIAAANAMVAALCDGKRKWIMTIPARPDHDPDLVISKALHLAKQALTPAPRVVVTEAMVEAMSRHVYQYALTTHADIRAGLTAALTEAPADA